MAKKIHTRVKRKHRLSTRWAHKFYFSGKTKPHRPKTFRTEEQANEYAKQQGIESYTIVPAKKEKRFKIETT